MGIQTTPVHGNYQGYYTKRPFLNDDRLLVLPQALFKHARVLDVGCNEGWVSCEIAQCHGAELVVGVDIDDKLIQGAWRRRRVVWSIQAPSFPGPPVDLDGEQSTARRKRQRVDPEHGAEPVFESTFDPKARYFPASCEHEFGSLPIPPAVNRGKETFPHNVSFRTADWVTTEIPEDKDGYDVVVAFSVSKWIHLNDGDEGLKMFFRRVFKVLKPGGAFILEPQPWDSYAKAKRMDSRLKENARHIQLRPDDFEAILKDIGFGSARHFGCVGEGGFNRPIDVYIKL